MYKIMILTDSDGCPRSFPASEAFELEETYPYLIREHFKSSTFWQLSYGDITTMKLVNQPMGYLTHWDPNIIIIQSGINDCKPEEFSDLQKDLKSSFRTTIKKFKLVFSKSKIFWLEICVGTRCEETCPGINRRVAEYNRIIAQVYGEDFVSVQKKMLEVDGFNAADHVHWNKRAHQAAADILIERINACIKL